MKRIKLTTLFLFAVVMAALAKDYSGTLLLKGLSSSDITKNDAPLSAYENTDGTYKIIVKDVSIDGYKLGDIYVDNMTAKKNSDGSISLTSTPSGKLNNVIATDGKDQSGLTETTKKLINTLIKTDSAGNWGLQANVTGTIKGDEIVIDIPYELNLIIYKYSLDIYYEGKAVAGGINDINADKTTQNTNCYNISGQQIHDGSRGIVIKDGRKYLSR